MTAFIFIATFLLILILTFVCIKNLRRVKYVARAAQALEATLAQSKHETTLMQAEINSLQTKLQFVNEDPVTHVLGRQLFEDRLGQTIKECERFKLTAAVLFVDIDDFNIINQAMGHAVGDLLLEETAKRLQSCIRKVDSISRFNKDTFVILLAQIAKPEGAAIVAQRMLHTLSQLFQIHDQTFSITASIGVAIYPADGRDVQTLLRSANHAMNLAKEKAHHSYQFFQEQMLADSQRELALLTGINSESCFHEFVLYYQPIVNVKSETVLCMDVLLEWLHPTMGVIHSEEIFNIAEKQQKANAVSEWMMRTACQQFLDWRALGFNPHMLGIPLSIRQLENTHFIYRISQLLQELQFKPEWLLLEIKDSTHPLSFDILEKAFNMLSYLGVRIALDQIGTGPISLQQLKVFPIHYLKLDRSLLADVEQNPRSQAIIQAMVILAENLSIELIIQGVESQTQLEKLKEIGCPLLQGQLLGGPLSKQDVVNKMTI